MKDSKQRLLEVMGKLDSSFKPKLNESPSQSFNVERDIVKLIFSQEKLNGLNQYNNLDVVDYNNTGDGIFEHTNLEYAIAMLFKNNRLNISDETIKSLADMVSNSLM